jgi:hypothetical protein
MKKLSFCFFILIILLNNFSCFGQNASDTIRIIRVETIYKDVFTGIFVSENKSDLVLITETLGEISIPKDQIKYRKNLKTPKNFNPLEKYRKVTISEKDLIYQDLERGKKLQRTGMILTLSGITAMTVGLIMMDYGWEETSNHEPKALWTGNIGAFLFTAGIPVTCVGIPILIGGSAKKNSAAKKLQISLVNFNTPVSRNMVSGLSFKLTF